MIESIDTRLLRFCVPFLLFCGSYLTSITPCSFSWVGAAPPSLFPLIYFLEYLGLASELISPPAGPNNHTPEAGGAHHTTPTQREPTPPPAIEHRRTKNSHLPTPVSVMAAPTGKAGIIVPPNNDGDALDQVVGFRHGGCLMRPASGSLGAASSYASSGMSLHFGTCPFADRACF